MAWRIDLIKAIALLGALACVQGISMKSQTFTSLVEKSCYGKDSRGNSFPLGQQDPGPLGQSIENFISLIEKIENFNGQRSSWNPQSLAAAILARSVTFILLAP